MDDIQFLHLHHCYFHSNANKFNDQRDHQAIDPNDFITKSNKIKVREMERWT